MNENDWEDMIEIQSMSAYYYYTSFCTAPSFEWGLFVDEDGYEEVVSA